MARRSKASRGHLGVCVRTARRTVRSRSSSNVASAARPLALALGRGCRPGTKVSRTPPGLAMWGQPRSQERQMGACERSKSALGVGHMGAGTTAPSCASRCVKQAVLRASSLPAWPSASSHAWVAPFAGGARPSSRKASASFSAASTGASKKGANTGPPLATNLATVASPTRLGEQTEQTGRFLADSANRETRSRAVRRGEARLRRGEEARQHGRIWMTG